MVSALSLCWCCSFYSPGICKHAVCIVRSVRHFIYFRGVRCTGISYHFPWLCSLDKWTRETFPFALSVLCVLCWIMGEKYTFENKNNEPPNPPANFNSCIYSSNLALSGNWHSYYLNTLCKTENFLHNNCMQKFPILLARCQWLLVQSTKICFSYVIDFDSSHLFLLRAFNALILFVFSSFFFVRSDFIDYAFRKLSLINCRSRFDCKQMPLLDVISNSNCSFNVFM